MVDFALTDENRLVQQAARAFAEAEILPHIREWDEEGEVHREVFGKMAEQGFLGAPIPERVGRRRAWTTSASRSCARSSSGPTRRSGSSRASTSG